MASLYDRKFNAGRQGEQILNAELHQIYESVKHLLDQPETSTGCPEAKLDGALWLDRLENLLKRYDKKNDRWKVVGAEKFQLVDQLLSALPPPDPVPGQLWLYGGVLCYFDGTNWVPVKALIQDGSQFNLSVFENFLLISPLWTIGNGVVEDEELAAYKEEMRKYLQNKLDFKDDAAVTGDGTKWTPDHECILDTPEIPVFAPTSKAQLVVPNMDVGRFFLNHKLCNDFEEVSKICIQLPRARILDKVPSLAHVNPGRLTGIKKRLIKVDRIAPKINILAHNTEFYGYQAGKIYGQLLLPTKAENTVGDYEILSDGIFLSYNACQNYDYILAVEYEFSWYKSTGALYKADNHSQTSSYYVNNYMAPVNVFVDGYNLEDPYYSADGISGTVTTVEDTSRLEVDIMRSVEREYGFIRMIDLKNRGIIKPFKTYRQPLYFVNGEALHANLNDYEAEDGLIYVRGAKRDMVWSIIELYDPKMDFNMFYEASVVTAQMENGEACIGYDTREILESDSVILFIDGLLVKKEEIVKEHAKARLTVPGLKLGQSYILLNDRYNFLYDEKDLIPALTCGKFSESLVYMNGYLLCNSTAVATVLDEEDETRAVKNEIKCFVAEGSAPRYKLYDDLNLCWRDLAASDIDGVKSFAYSYNNALRSVELLASHDKSDDIRIYAYNYANAIEHPLIIHNVLVEETDTVCCKSTYIPNIGSLSVWLNGIRQYPQRVTEDQTIHGIVEDKDGDKFYFPQPVTGLVTYVIQHPEDQSSIACTREILDHNDAVSGTVNIYKTQNSLYPGRVTVYVNGIRQPKEAFTVLDNETIFFNDPTTMLIGNENNYPEKTVLKDYEIRKYTLAESDKVLIEVSQIERQEQTIQLNENTQYDIRIAEYDLDIGILDAVDEILIFCDGMYWGAAHLDGYVKNTNRGVITVSDRNILDGINSDPLFTCLNAHPEKKEAYKKKHGGKDHAHHRAKLTLEWR